MNLRLRGPSVDKGPVTGKPSALLTHVGGAFTDCLVVDEKQGYVVCNVPSTSLDIA